MAGSLRFHHSCRQSMRSMASTANGGRQPSAWWAPRARGPSNATSFVQGTTCSISSKKISLLVLLCCGSRPRVVWFMSTIMPAYGVLHQPRQPWVLQTFPVNKSRQFIPLSIPTAVDTSCPDSPSNRATLKSRPRHGTNISH